MLPLVVLGAGVLGGPRAAAEVAVSGAFATMNLGLMAWIGSGFVHGVAVGNAGGIYGPLVVLKMAAALPLFILLMFAVAPLHAVVGLCSAVAGVGVTGLELALLGDAALPTSTVSDPLES